MATTPPFGRISGDWKVLENSTTAGQAAVPTARLESTSEQPAPLQQDAQGRTARFGLMAVTLVALGILVSIYLIYRGHTFFVAISLLHPALGAVYLATVAIIVLGVSWQLFLLCRRYRQIEVVSRVQPLLKRVQAGRANVQDERSAYEYAASFARRFPSRLRISNTGLRENARLELENRAGKLLNSLRNHRGGKLALDELEQYLLTKLDEHADRVIQTSALTVAIGTTLASGLLDSVIVGVQSLRLIDQIATLYAGRPGMLGTLRLLRRALASIAFAEIAEVVTEVVVQTSSSAALAKLGGRAAQGFGNGVLLIRLGESVKLQCRLLQTQQRTSAVKQLLDAILDRFNSKPVQAA